MSCDIFLRIGAFDPGGIRFFAQFNFFWQLLAFAVEIVKQKLSFPTKIHIHVDFAEKTSSFDSSEFLLHVALVSYLDPLRPGASGTIWLLRSACSLTNLIFPGGYSIHVMLFCHLLLVTCVREHCQRDTVYFCVQHCAEISGFGLSGQNGLWCSFSLFTVHCKFN